MTGPLSQRRPVLPASCGLRVVGHFLPSGCPREEKKVKLDLQVERLCSAVPSLPPSPAVPQPQPHRAPSGTRRLLDSQVLLGRSGEATGVALSLTVTSVALGALCSPAPSPTYRTCRVTLWLPWLALGREELPASPAPPGALSSSPGGVSQGGTPAQVPDGPLLCPAPLGQCVLCEDLALTLLPGTGTGTSLFLPPAVLQSLWQTVMTSCPAGLHRSPCVEVDQDILACLCPLPLRCPRTLWGPQHTPLALRQRPERLPGREGGQLAPRTFLQPCPAAGEAGSAPPDLRRPAVGATERPAVSGLRAR